MTHYHVYMGLNGDSMPKDIFNFTNSQKAIDKVMEIVEGFGSYVEECKITHIENELGRLSTIVIPHVNCKIILHECKCITQDKNPLDPIDKCKLN